MRHALEPWHVHGRGGRRPAARCATSTPRSSACRSRSTGLAGERYVVTCNGRAVPLQPDRHGRRVRRRRALPGLAAAVGAASDHRRARAAGLRSGRHLERPLARRLPVPRRPSRRAQLRDLPGQCLRGRGAPRWRASSASAIRRAWSTRRRSQRNPSFPFTLDLRRPSAENACAGRPARACFGHARPAVELPKTTDRFDEMLADDGGASRRTGSRFLPTLTRRRPRADATSALDASAGASARTASPTTSTPIRRGRPAVGARSAAADHRAARVAGDLGGA